MSIQLPEHIIYFGERRFMDFVRNNRLGYGAFRVKDRPFVRRCTTMDEIRGLRGDNCMYVFEEGYEEYMACRKPEEYRQIRHYLSMQQVRSWEQVLFGVN